MKGPIRVLIADGHRLRREGLGLMLGDEDGIEVVGEAVNGIQTIALVDDLKPDVVLLDISLPELEGIQAILPIRQKSPHSKTLVLVHVEDESTVFKLLKAGAKGYLSDDSAASDIPRAIRALHRGELWAARSMVSRFVDQEAIADSSRQNARENNQNCLTSREQEVLKLLTKGSTNKEIAQVLFISEKTVKCHVNNIFKKLNVTRRLQAVLYAMGKGLG